MMGGDGITSDEFASVGGPGVRRHADDLRPRSAQASRTRKSRGRQIQRQEIDPEAYTLYSYAGVQIIKQAAEAAKSPDPKKVAEEMHKGMNSIPCLATDFLRQEGRHHRSRLRDLRLEEDPAARSRTLNAPGSDAEAQIRNRTSSIGKSPPRRAGFFQPILPSTGKVSSSHTLIWLMLPVRNAIPVKTSNAPMACSTR